MQAIELKAQIKRMEDQRDQFDARYETSRYEASLVCGDTAQAKIELQV